MCGEYQKRKEKLNQVNVNNAHSAFIFLIYLLINQGCRTGSIIQGGPGGPGCPGGPGGPGGTGGPGCEGCQGGPGGPCGPHSPGCQGGPGGQPDIHSESLWLTWSKPSDYSEKLRCHTCDGQA